MSITYNFFCVNLLLFETSIQDDQKWLLELSQDQFQIRTKFMITQIQIIKQFKNNEIYFEIAITQTSTNTCSNDPLIMKFDLRDYINKLGVGKKISDIQSQALCDLVQRYDYVWLTQIWTPSIYNYQSNINPTQAKDYKILQNIREYSLDPTLGTTQDLRQLKTNLNQICYHTKFLGEFSFYVGKDSSLLQNQTRFLRIPDDQIPRTYTYNPSYDDDGIIWAFDDFGRTIPNSAMWNLFSQTVITDIKDIIYRQILTQYNLDGIVFLQPSLGLYSFNTNFYQSEVSYFGQSGYLQDFYVSFGLQNTVQTYFFMGGEDNSNLLQNFTNQGLQIIYTAQVNNYDKTWANVNFTFDPTGYQPSMTYSNLTIQRSSYNPGAAAVFVRQSLPLNQKSCFRVKFNILYNTIIGVGIKSTIVSTGYVPNLESLGSGIFGLYDWKVINSEDATLDQKSLAFKYSDGDTIEAQYDPLNQTIVFRKFQTNLKYQMYISTDPATLQYLVTIGQADYQIQFPFWFSTTQKTTSATVQDNRNFLGTVTQGSLMLQFGQILPNLNLFDTTTLNIQIKKLPTNQIVAVGICNQEVMNNRAQTLNPSQAGGGAYMMISNGKTFHSDSQFNNNQTTFTYKEGDTISITYTPGQNVFFDNNKTLNYTLSLLNFIKNVNFCVSFTTAQSAFYLVY
ncbi:hypothetical protein pb186bvf_014985 [Paramecium bursaria]